MTISPARKGRKRKQFQVELEVKFVPCPPEHAPAYWLAWKTLFELLDRAILEEKTDAASEPT